MAINIPSISEITEQWVRGAAQGAAAYRRGVENSSVDWEGPTSAAQEVWKLAVTEAAGTDRFQNGVQLAGNSKWRRKSAELGANRFPSGVASAASDYSRGFDPFRNVIAGLDLPPRGARGSAQNLERVRRVTEALHTERLRIIG